MDFGLRSHLPQKDVTANPNIRNIGKASHCAINSTSRAATSKAVK